jgi:hypothetical protein
MLKLSRVSMHYQEARSIPGLKWLLSDEVLR